jgi:hypothetical protein
VRGAISRTHGNATPLRRAQTPFLPERQNEGPAADLRGTGPKVECPWCQHAFPVPSGDAPAPTPGTSGSSQVVDALPRSPLRIVAPCSPSRLGCS